MVKAVIFDVDGTLLDSEKIYMQAWREVGLEFGYDIPEQALKETRAVRPSIAREIFRQHCGQDFPYDECLTRRAEISERLFAEQTKETLLMPYAEQTLQWLTRQGIPMAVASSTRYEKTCTHLRQGTLLDYFSAVVGGDMVTQGKPAPDIFLKAAQLLDAEPSECVVVGDTPADVSAAAAAGMKMILIPDQVPANEQTIAMSRKVLSGLHQLPEALEELL